MTVSADAHAKTAQKLIGILSEGRVPTHLRQKAEELVDRMTKPVRLTVFGFPGSGKSTLVNLLLGSRVLDPKDRLPTVQITHGEAVKSRCTLADGSTRDFSHFDTAEIASSTPIFVTAEMPLPALGKISVMEVVATGGPAELQRALAWASDRTDIAIWCTQTFPAAEQAVWRGAAEDMKDHGFMVLTKADTLAREGRLTNVVASLQQQSGEEFNRILPIATLDAIAARAPDGSIDRDRLARSGGRALIAEILREVDLGRQAAVDQAEILVRQYPSKAAAKTAAVAEAPEQAVPEAPQALPAGPAPEGAKAGGPEKVAPQVSAPVRSRPLSPVPSRPAVAPVNLLAAARTTVQTAEAAPNDPALPNGAAEAETPDMPAIAPAALSPATRAAFEHAVDRLIRHGRQFADVAGQGGNLDPALLMQETVSSVQWLSDYLSENGESGDAALARMREAAFDAADLLHLMQIENDTNAVGEFVGIAIQLKREMESGLAA